MSVTQIFVVGSSSVYGVGGTHGGWADLIKQWLHQKMYADKGLGEKYEVFNFGRSGATIDFVKDNFSIWLEQFWRGGPLITITSVGGNNMKAVDEPDNYVSTQDEYRHQMSELFGLLKETSQQVIAVGSGYVDESKTNPKMNPFTGGKSFFTNKRRQQFTEVYQTLCVEKDIPFVGVDLSESDWLESYVYTDGLHANDQGQRYLFEKIKQILEPQLS